MTLVEINHSFPSFNKLDTQKIFMKGKLTREVSERPWVRDNFRKKPLSKSSPC